jgi:protein TonB
MGAALDPATSRGDTMRPLAGRALAEFEPDDPELNVPEGAQETGLRVAPEHHLPADDSGAIIQKPAEPLGPRPTKALDRGRKWIFAVAVSCVFHVALALFFISADEEAVQEEGADFAGVALLGSPEDEVSAGEVADQPNTVEVTMVTILEAVPVVVAEKVPGEEASEAVEVAEAVAPEPEMLTPVEAQPARSIKTQSAEPAQPAESLQRVIAEPQPTVAAAEQIEAERVPQTSASFSTEIAAEILTTDRADPVEDDNLVPPTAEPVETVVAAQPIETMVGTRQQQASVAPTQGEQVEPTESQTAEAVQTSPVGTAATASDPVTIAAESNAVQPEMEAVEAEAIQTPAEAPRPEPKPEMVAEATPIEEPAERKAAAKPIGSKNTPIKAPAAERQPPKKAEQGRTAKKSTAEKRTAGKGGQNQANARRGQSDGQENGDSGQASRGGSRNGAVGNAAVSNYPGKVRSKLVRASRSVRARGRGDVVVSFAVASNGSVRSARVSRSSGDAAVDQAALQAVRKAAPFPPIPAGSGRSSWQFDIPLAFRR